jgi:site-specific DNA-cytosine methylase
MDFYDFFSGCGGTSQGMREAGLRVRLGIDVDPDAAQTYQANFPKADFIWECELANSDVTEILKNWFPIAKRRA